MKSIPTTLREHLDSEVTALCTCWSIERVDGKVLRFTDADEDVIQDGDTYKSIGAYKRTAIETTSTLSVDNLEIVGAASDLSLPEEELRAGLFDNAQVTIFMTPWMESVKGRLRLRRGFFGEVQTIPNNTYQVELRGVMQRLSYNYTDIFSSSCLYDLGEKKCGINIKGQDLAVGQIFETGDFARVAQNSYEIGKAYDLGWNDPDFEIAGAAGLNQSIAWYNSGVNPLIIASDEQFTGTYSARGSGGPGTLSQDIDLENDTGLPTLDLDAERTFLTLRAFRRDVNTQGRFSAQFLDRDGTELGYGKVLNAYGVTPTQLNFTGDFTIELWVNMTGAVDSNQTIFGAGTSFSGVNQAERLSFEGGTLTYRNSDGVRNDAAQVILQAAEITAGGVWTHVALTRSGNTLSLYQDFDLVDSAVFTEEIIVDRWGDGPSVTSFTGLWDELRVWSVGKQGFELAIDGRRASSPASAGLLRYYSFNDANGADLTASDLSFEFGSGSLVTGNGSPVAVAAIYATDLGSATYTTGYQDTSATWNEVGVQDHKIPNRARLMRVSFDVLPVGGNPVDARIDNLTGHIINTGEDGIVIGYMTNNVAWRATSPGVGNTNSANGGVGSTLSGVGVNLVGENAYLRAGRVISATDARTFIAEIDEPRAVDAWFNGGSVIFETGDNAGAAMEVKSWDAALGQVELFLSLPANIKAGDYFSIYPGCDKSRISCAAIFRNIQNFFGSPDIPGQDELYRYPDAR